MDFTKTYLGIELGSTRIKSVLIDENYRPIAQGEHQWENKLVDGYWTYSLDDVWQGLRNSYAELAKSVEEKHGQKLSIIGGVGISAMMHGYLAFDKNDNLLVPFRTWRNTTTEEAASKLTDAFGFNIPQRWSIAHLYQAVLNKEEHIEKISHVTTLAGYVHWKLTGEKVLGIGDASGMFPVEKGQYTPKMAEIFSEIAGGKKIEEIFPEIILAGENAGKLTKSGAKLLDPSGSLQEGIKLCPPEGDAGTGMVATNAISKRTGNISAGTSVFAMLVLENDLKSVYTEVDMVTTPTGVPVAMVHCNNFTSDIDAWVNLFSENLSLFGASVSKTELYEKLYNLALTGEADCDGLLSYNYFAGEPITALEEGRPMFVRMPDSKFNMPNFMRTHIFSAMATLKIGMDILAENEGVSLDSLQGHGGFFKTEKVGQSLMASALDIPVSVMETSGEGGAWGIALLAAYMDSELNLDEFLAKKVFTSVKSVTMSPIETDKQGFKKFMTQYKKGINVQKSAVKNLK